ncbi:MAG: ATP-dependent 6-phosphofructokinase [Gemmatimonadota bacterium]|nr:MAG: ATP-dependent 6-phosphofructokinase [Gemmatimonadota bacterium]
MSRRRIALLTGGGDAPGLNAVIRAVVKSAVGRGWEVLGIRDGFEGLLSRSGLMPLVADDVRGILQTGGTILGSSNRGDPFRFPEEKDGKVVRVDRSAEVVAKIKTLSLDALIVIGGDGSLSIAQRLGEMGVPVVGIPKTIDNDVVGTDLTFGFNTACQTAMAAIDRLHTTAASHHRVMVIEVMGRDAGWIALKAGASGGGDVILIPEIPYSIQAICQKFAEREARGARFSLVVVSEGAHPEGAGKVVAQTADKSRTGYERLGGVGHALAREIEDSYDTECRVTVLGHVQRGGTPTTMDRMLGTRFGVGAVNMVEAGEFQRMVALRCEQITSAPLADVTGALKLVDPDGEEVRALESIGVSFGRPRRGSEADV